jgi:hypothetical protein
MERPHRYEENLHHYQENLHHYEENLHHYEENLHRYGENLHRYGENLHHYEDGSPGSTLIAAMPPDVRRGCASPERTKIAKGLCPRFGLCPTSLGQRPYPGLSPFLFFLPTGRAEPRLTSGGEAAPR